MASKQTFPGKRIRKLDEAALWEYALRSMSRRAYSSNEIKLKLLQRAESSACVTAVMNKLRQYGFADDQKYSETFASARLQNQGFGRFRVLRDLRARRVAPAVAEQAVAKAFDGTEENQLIEQFLARKYRSKDLRVFLQEEKNAASVYRRLRTAGFSSGASFAALKRHSQRTMEDWEEPVESE